MRRRRPAEPEELAPLPALPADPTERLRVLRAWVDAHEYATDTWAAATVAVDEIEAFRLWDRDPRVTAERLLRLP